MSNGIIPLEFNTSKVYYWIKKKKKKNQIKMVIVSDSYLADGDRPDVSALVHRVFPSCPCVVCNVFRWKKKLEVWKSICYMESDKFIMKNW